MQRHVVVNTLLGFLHVNRNFFNNNYMLEREGYRDFKDALVGRGQKQVAKH